MANPYYTNEHRIGAGGFARGDQVDRELQLIEEGFAGVAAAVGGAFAIKNNADSPVAAVAGAGYFVDLSTGAVIITLPAAPTIVDAPIAICVLGAITNTLTIARNGKNIMGLAEDMTVDIANANFRLVFSDNTRGWRLLNA